MSNSFYPTTTSQVALVSPASGIVYEAQVSMVAGIYNYQATATHSVDFYYQNSYITSFTLSAAGGSFSVSSPIDRIIFWQNTGANQGATISLVTTVSTQLTGSALTYTSSQTVNLTGFAYAILVGGGGAGTSGNWYGYGGYYVGYNSRGSGGGGGGSGYVTSGHLTLTGSMPVVIGSGGTGGTGGGDGSSGGNTTFGPLTANGGAAAANVNGGGGQASGAKSAYGQFGQYASDPLPSYSGGVAAISCGAPYNNVKCGTIAGGGGGGGTMVSVRYYSYLSGNAYAGGVGNLGQGGNGGSSSGGGCGRQNDTQNGCSGTNATGIGSGGGGSTSAGFNGGNGSSGAVYIIQYA